MSTGFNMAYQRFKQAERENDHFMADIWRKILNRYPHPLTRLGDNTPDKLTELSWEESRYCDEHRGAIVDGKWWGWDKIRKYIYERDETCMVCGADGDLEAGHIISRMYGGSDHPNNLVAMCSICNRVLNPEHETKESFWQWVDTDPYNKFWDNWRVKVLDDRP